MKTIILLYTDGTPCGILTVQNYDDNFNSSLAEAEHNWGNSTDEYTDFVLRALRARHYSVDINTNFTTYQTIL